MGGLGGKGRRRVAAAQKTSERAKQNGNFFTSGLLPVALGTPPRLEPHFEVTWR